MTANHNQAVESVSTLYHQFQKPIFRYLSKLTGSTVLAEELTQETFYQAFLSIHRFRGDSKVSTWLYQIARHVYGKHRRSISKQDDLRREMQNRYEGVHSTNRRPDRVLEKRWEQERVLQTLQALPEQYRTVLLLKEMEGLSHRAIAQIMGKTESTTKVILFRAKKKFQTAYQEQEDDQ